MSRTRLAPSPTGALHLGNARTFLVNWALARQQGWQIVLRIDDLDGPRVKPQAAAESIEILKWLGIDWDEGPDHQTQHLSEYRQSLEKLAAQGDIYPCRCTRSQIAASLASAPHAGEHELRYAGTCRPAEVMPLAPAALDDPHVSWRMRVPAGEHKFIDKFVGEFREDMQATTGDFRIAGLGGTPSYQLAVVVDDARQQVDQIVRGDDLLSSTPRQMLIRQRLGLGPEPTYHHLPLVVGSDGRRLAKRHGDTRLSTYRQQGVAAEAIVGVLAQSCGVGRGEAQTAQQFAANFSIDQLPPQAVVWTIEDERRLYSL